jgi:hypothetical protein
MEAQVLKLRHSLIGKSLIPVILRVKGFEDKLQGERMARLKKGSLSYTVLHGGVYKLRYNITPYYNSG